MRTLFKTLLGVAVLPIFLTTADLSARSNRIAVKAQASEEFIRSRATDISKKIQTYHVVEGIYFGGNTYDPSMDRITFMDIARNMAANLRRQNFFSEPDPNKGDLLLMVHYGATDYEASFMEEMGIDSLDDLGIGSGVDGSEFDEFEAEDAFLNDLSAMRAFNASGQMSRRFKTKLLGMEVRHGSTNQEAFELRQLVNEERYFICVIAFDLPAYRNGEKKVLWTTRYSVRAIGQPFDVAVGEMNFVASNFFGKNLEGLNSKRASDKSEVIIGEIEVLGQEED